MYHKHITQIARYRFLKVVLPLQATTWKKRKKKSSQIDSREDSLIHLSASPGGVLGISSDWDDQRIFLGLKFSIVGFFWVRKFGLVRDLSRDFLGVLKRIR